MVASRQHVPLVSIGGGTVDFRDCDFALVIALPSFGGFLHFSGLFLCDGEIRLDLDVSHFSDKQQTDRQTDNSTDAQINRSLRTESELCEDG